MIKSVESFKRDIRQALKNANKYNKSLEPQILALSGSLRSLALANEEIDNLTSATIESVNRFGTTTITPHPVFRIQRDQQDAVTRQMKALGLTADALAGTDEHDPLIDLTKKVKESSKKSVIVKRCKEGES